MNLIPRLKLKKTTPPKNKQLKKTIQKSLSGLSFNLKKLSSHLYQISIEIDPEIVKSAYIETIELYKAETNPLGIDKNRIPSEYIEIKHQNEILNKLKIFQFKYFILDFLIHKIKDLKIPLANYPRLTKIINDGNFKLKYIFDVSIADAIELKEWKNFIFRPPKRKKYKDLDKQVENFIKEENLATKKQNFNIIEENDWVLFDAFLVDNKKVLLWPKHQCSFCIKIGTHHLINAFQKLFLDKKTGDSFFTNRLPLEEESSLDGESNNYLFMIKINAITKGDTFLIDTFKSTFKLKSKQDIHRKLIEAFSFKDDLSQRYSTIEELFHLLLSKHRFEVPTHIVIRRQEDILLSLMKQPDYQVYKTQKDFSKQIALLAEQQLKEEILIDQITYTENISANENDIQNYLFLLNHNKLREFIHFKPLHEQLEKTNIPLNACLLNQIACREKTLNHIIHMLTK